MLNPYLKKPKTSSAAPVASLKQAPSVEPQTASCQTEIYTETVPEQDQKMPAVETVVTAPVAAAIPAAAETFGERDSAVDRLTSRNVSFGSAEVLTVQEIHKHVSLYMDQAVRITGVVLHRLVMDSGNAVVLVLGDPLLSSSSVQPKRKPPVVRPVLKTPGNKRRVLIKKTPTSSSLLGRKRPLMQQKKVDPLDAAVTTLTGQPSVLVYASSTEVPVNDVTVGDLAMVIGQMCAQTVPSCIKALLEKWNNKKTQGGVWFVHSRIVRNVNGTDMRLHWEALQLRRQHLIKASNTDDALRPGCGPPPYYTNDDDQKQASV